MKELVLILLVVLFSQTNAAPCNDKLPYSSIPDGFCPREWAKSLNYPRGLHVASNNDILVLESGQNAVTALYDLNGDGISDVGERVTIARAPDINHGIDVYGGYLYASSPTTVYRWRYNTSDRKDLGRPEVVIKNVPCCHHITRTLRFNVTGELFVQSGSGSNVDADSSHSQIRKFSLKNIPANWQDGELYYDGLRNEVGLRFDSLGRLWGVENGCDNLRRNDLGGDVHNDNPSEEVNIFTEKAFYGYPYCWSEGKLDPKYAKGPGTQWFHPNFPSRTDQWCEANSKRPAFNLPAHTAPLDILFVGNDQSFPSKYQGNAIVSLHGSWNRQVPVGYSLVHLIIDKNTHLPISSETFLQNNGTQARWTNNIRPVSLGWAKCKNSASGNCLYMSSDASGNIIEISFRG